MTPRPPAPLSLSSLIKRYDTGGLALKPKEGMCGMKMDMGGAAGLLLLEAGASLEEGTGTDPDMSDAAGSDRRVA